MDARHWVRTLDSVAQRHSRSVPAPKRAEFFQAVADGQLATVRKLLKKTPALWSAALEETGGNVFHLLASSETLTEDQLAVARYLLRSNANSVKLDNNDSTPLRTAMVRGCVELTRLLLPLGAATLDARRFARKRLDNNEHSLSPDARFFGAATLHLLVRGGDPYRHMLVATLLNDEAIERDVLALDGNSRPPLAVAIACGNERAARYLLRAGAPVDASAYVESDCADDSRVDPTAVFAARDEDLRGDADDEAAAEKKAKAAEAEKKAPGMLKSHSRAVIGAVKLVLDASDDSDSESGSGDGAKGASAPESDAAALARELKHQNILDEVARRERQPAKRPTGRKLRPTSKSTRGRPTQAATLRERGEDKRPLNKRSTFGTLRRKLKKEKGV